MRLYLVSTHVSYFPHHQAKSVGMRLFYMDVPHTYFLSRNVSKSIVLVGSDAKKYTVNHITCCGGANY